MKREMVVIGIILFFVCINVSASFVKEIPDESTVGFYDNILYVGGIGPNNYTSIQDAIDDANYSDTVFVYSGIYHEYNITIDKSINLIGEDRETTIIYGINISTTLKINCKWLNISGFTINNGLMAIEIVNSDLLISNCNLSSNRYGISNIFIRDWSEPYESLNGIVFIKDNIFWNNSEMSISILGGNDLFISISDNYFINNNVGCFIVCIFNGVISNNFFEDNNNTLEISYGNNLNINNNNICNNNFGFSAMLLYNSLITLNNICNNNYGIKICGGGNHIFQNNLINNNLSAKFERFAFIEVLGKIQMIVIYPNFFKYSRILSKNKWDENYWNGPRTKPYLIRGNFYIIFNLDRNPIPLFNIDWHPASEPYYIES